MASLLYINTINIFMKLYFQKKLERRVALFYIFMNLFNVQLHGK